MIEPMIDRRPFRLSALPAPRLVAPRPPARNDLVAERERLAREERLASERLDKVRGELDEVSNQLGGASPGTTARDSEGDPALWMVNQDRSRRGLPPLAKLEPGAPQPKRGGAIDPIATAAAILSAGRNARGEPDE
jgi:hypothetical protein